MSRKSALPVSLLWDWARMMLEAQAVIGMRLAGMAGFWAVSPGEDRTMVTEKMEAMAEAGLAMQRAMMRGAAPATMMAAALAPVSKRTRANSRRLYMSGPKLR